MKNIAITSGLSTVLAEGFSAEADEFLADRYSVVRGRPVVDKKSLEELKALGYVH